MVIEKRLKNEDTMGRLIERELVKHHVLGMVDAMARRLLRDTPKTIARRLYGLARSGAAVEDAEQVLRDLLSSQITPAKASAARALRRSE